MINKQGCMEIRILRGQGVSIRKVERQIWALGIQGHIRYVL